jgi:hypothetical protein
MFIMEWVWVDSLLTGNYPLHTQILLGNLFLPIPYPNTMGMGLDTGNGYSPAGLAPAMRADVAKSDTT